MTRKVEVLVKAPPTISSRHEEDATLKRLTGMIYYIRIKKDEGHGNNVTPETMMHSKLGYSFIFSSIKQGSWDQNIFFLNCFSATILKECRKSNKIRDTHGS